MIKIKSIPNTLWFIYFRFAFTCIFQLVVVSCFAQSSSPIINYPTPQTYKINQPVTPLAPTNTGGAIPAATYGSTTTIAGGFSTPTSVCVDAVNNVAYLSEWDKNLIKKITLNDGAVSTYAGTGATGTNDGPVNTATFYEPDAIIRDATGNLYISDQSNNLIRKITPAKIVSTLASGFNNPRGLTVDAAGNIYVADQGNNCIKKITPAGVVTTVASGFNTPTGVDVDASGNLFVSELGSGAIKEILTNGAIVTIVANIGHPRELRVDAVGNIYVADQEGNAIKKITAAGVVNTLSTAVYGPIGLSLDGFGNIYVADSGSGSVKKISFGGYSIDKALPAGLNFNTATGVISGTPTMLSAATDYTIIGYNLSGSSITKVNIAVTDGRLPSNITFPGFDSRHFDGNIVDPGAYSTNTETPIIYTSDNPAVATTTADGRLQIHGPGKAMITANQAGNANYLPAIPVTSTLTVIFGQQLDFPTIATKTACSADFALNAADAAPDFDFPSSGLPITYTSSNPAVATVSASGMVHILSTGTTQITAYQKGDNIYYADADPVSQTLTITGAAKPLVNITHTPANICDGFKVTFKANVSNLPEITNPSYQWVLNGNNVGANSNQFIAVVNNADKLQCLVSNNAACPSTGASDILDIPVSRNPPLNARISSLPEGPVCQGTSVKFIAASNNTITKADYQWQVNGVSVGTNDSVYVSNNFNDGDKITCTVNNGISRFCATPSTSPAITLRVLPLANINASVIIQTSGNNVYAGTTVTFSVIPSNMAGILSYQWQVNGKNAGSNSTNFTTTALNNGDVIACIVSSSLPCTIPAVSPSITETVLPPLQITPPNAFTPNGDGVNDTWLIAGLNTYPNCTVAVYNRYGAQVYYSKGYIKPWDGNESKGLLPVGTYYYVIELNQNRPRATGYVTIIR